jgi:hypothetical protein
MGGANDSLASSTREARIDSSRRRAGGLVVHVEKGRATAAAVRL